LKESGTLSLDRNDTARSDGHVIVHAVLINILNPKLSIFFLAFLPQFVDASAGSALLQMVPLSGVFMAMTFVVFTIYGLFATLMRDHVISRPRVLQWIRRTFAAAFVGLGAKLAVSDR
jgi:threonine/homoserine/homoserine lactone efflux protein